MRACVCSLFKDIGADKLLILTAIKLMENDMLHTVVLLVLVSDAMFTSSKSFLDKIFLFL